MRPYTFMPVTPEKSERAPRGASVLALSGTCPTCGRPLTARQRVCSGRCRAASSRWRRVEAQTERTRRVRELLEAVALVLSGPG
jgi:predicted nucleic acid-binding Zn ribbon protein